MGKVAFSITVQRRKSLEDYLLTIRLVTIWVIWWCIVYVNWWCWADRVYIYSVCPFYVSDSFLKTRKYETIKINLQGLDLSRHSKSTRIKIRALDWCKDYSLRAPSRTRENYSIKYFLSTKPGLSTFGASNRSSISGFKITIWSLFDLKKPARRSKNSSVGQKHIQRKVLKCTLILKDSNIHPILSI